MEEPKLPHHLMKKKILEEFKEKQHNLTQTLESYSNTTLSSQISINNVITATTSKAVLPLIQLMPCSSLHLLLLLTFQEIKIFNRITHLEGRNTTRWRVNRALPLKNSIQTNASYSRKYLRKPRSRTVANSPFKFLGLFCLVRGIFPPQFTGAS